MIRGARGKAGARSHVYSVYVCVCVHALHIELASGSGVTLGTARRLLFTNLINNTKTKFREIRYRIEYIDQKEVARLSASINSEARLAPACKCCSAGLPALSALIISFAQHVRLRQIHSSGRS